MGGSPVRSHQGPNAPANAHKGKVTHTFCNGARPVEPEELFSAGLTGNQRRAIDFREGDEIESAALGRLVREAVSHNRTHSVPEGNGSRAPD